MVPGTNTETKLMKKSFGIAALLILLALLWTAPATTQGPAGTGDEVSRLVEQLEGLNRSLGHLVVLMERSLDNQQVDQLLKRINLRDSRLAPLESELRRAEREVEEHETWVAHMKTELEETEERLREATRTGNEPDAVSAREMVEQIRSIIEGQEKQRDTLHERVRRLEDELADGRDELAVLEEMLRERLE
jgi:peptidoglycan hydrolase CwlO-like protein